MINIPEQFTWCDFILSCIIGGLVFYIYCFHVYTKAFKKQLEKIMASTDQRDKATKYKFEAEWNGHDGWHFCFGTKHLWEIRNGYMVADLKEKDGREQYQNHEEFTDLSEALEYMRTNKR